MPANTTLDRLQSQIDARKAVGYHSTECDCARRGEYGTFDFWLSRGLSVMRGSTSFCVPGLVPNSDFVFCRCLVSDQRRNPCPWQPPPQWISVNERNGRPVVKRSGSNGRSRKPHPAPTTAGPSPVLTPMLAAIAKALGNAHWYNGYLESRILPMIEEAYQSLSPGDASTFVFRPSPPLSIIHDLKKANVAHLLLNDVESPDSVLIAKVIG